jgi:ADP-heptose:LPS heptosyltransferase
MSERNINITRSLFDIYLKNKERVVFRWKKLVIKLGGYFIDLKCILFVPQLSRFINYMLKPDKDILTIGIVREGGIGDRMILGVFAEAVKRKFPNSHITAIVNNSKEPLTRNNAINKVRLYKSVHWDKIEKINQYRYDILYLLKYVPKVIVNNASFNGYKKDVDNIFKQYSNIYNQSVGHNIPKHLQMLNKNSIDFLCQCACLDGGQKDLSLTLTQKENNFVKKLQIDKYVTINNGDFRGRGNKCWPTDRWKELVKKLKEIGLSAVQLGIKRDEYVEGSHDLREKTTIYEAAAIIKGGVFHIDTEGGFVFIAKAVGKRSVVLFGPTYVECFGLESNINIRTKEDFCDPCCDHHGWYWNCPLGYNSCKAMEAITPEDVFQEVLKLEAINSNSN